MSWNEGVKTFTSGEALAKHRRVKLDSNLAAVYADAGEDYIGVTLYAVADATPVSIKLKNYPGTVVVTAAGTFTARDMLWGAADGKVDDVPAGEVQFYALKTSGAAGDEVECLPWADVGNFFTSIDDANGNEEIELTATTSAVNHLAVTNAATGGTPSLKSAGDNTDVNLLIGVKGAGDITVTAGDDLTLQSGVAASDLVSVKAYDVDQSAYDSLIVATSGNTPTLALTADGAITIDGTGGTADITITSGNDLYLRTGPANSDLIKIQARDVDGSAWDDSIVVTAGATPTVAIAADGGITLTGALVVNGAQTWSDAAGTGGAVIGAVSGQDIQITSGDDLLLRSGVAASDLVKVQAYDVDASAYDDLIIATAGNTPTLALQADGGLVINAGITLSDAAGTGGSVIGAVSGQDITITSGDDLLLRSGVAASDLVKIQAYDVDGSAYVDMLTATASNTPSLALAAVGAITISGAGGVADMTLTSGNDLFIRSGPAIADVVKVQAYDVDGSAFDDMIVASAANAPTLALAADGGISLTGAVTTNGAQTWSDAAGTGGAVIGAVAGQDIQITSGDDLLLRAGVANADLLKLQGYDVDASAYDDNIVVSSAAAPTVAVQADGGITLNGAIVLSNAAGTGAATVGAVAGQDVTITSGDDLILQSSVASGDTVTIQAYDVDASAYATVFVASSANAVELGFFGKTPAAQVAHVADVATAYTQTTTTELVTLAQKINAVLVAIETHGLVATS